MDSCVRFMALCMSLITLCDCQKELRLLSLLPMTPKATSGGWACLIPIKLAIAGINTHPDLLPGYNLTFEYADNEV